jgi:hypothetical protein
MKMLPTMQALHGVRERLGGERTALVHEVHRLMHEYGMVMPREAAKFRLGREVFHTTIVHRILVQ